MWIIGARLLYHEQTIPRMKWKYIAIAKAAMTRNIYCSPTIYISAVYHLKLAPPRVCEWSAGLPFAVTVLNTTYSWLPLVWENLIYWPNQSPGGLQWSPCTLQTKPQKSNYLPYTLQLYFTTVTIFSTASYQCMNKELLNGSFEKTLCSFVCKLWGVFNQIGLNLADLQTYCCCSCFWLTGGLWNHIVSVKLQVAKVTPHCVILKKHLGE